MFVKAKGSLGLEEGICAKGEIAQGYKGTECKSNMSGVPGCIFSSPSLRKKIGLGSYPACSPSSLGCED